MKEPIGMPKAVDAGRNIFLDEAGQYWHRDETEDLIGPFASEFAANEALQDYCRWLNQPKEKPL